MRRLILLLVAAITVAFCLDNSDLSATTSKQFAGPDTPANLINGEKPNVLFIAIDDLNDWVGCMGGNPQVKTPNLDAFNAQGGMVMYNAHAPATVCCPSRSALLSGVHSYKTGVYGNNNNLRYAPKAQDLVTMPQYFSQNGYTSLTMGKIFHRHPILGDDSGKKNDHGQWAFDEYYNTLGGMGPASSERPVNGLPNLPDEGNSYHSTAFDWGPTQYNDETKMLDHLTASWAADQLKNRDFEKPFFMAIGISKPHLTWYVPQKYFDMYPLEDIVLPEVLPEDLEDILDRYGKQAFGPHDTWRRVEAYDRHEEAVRAYLATITFVDDCIGVLLDGLANSKYADNTIVMLWGDHGWHLGEKMKYGKTQLWQESCRVPMMVKVPDVTPDNKTCTGVVNLIDMYPTLIELCGLPANPTNDGRSFAELLHNPDTVWNEPTLTTMGYGNHRIFDGRYSYINHSGRGVEQLYDHQADSMEWNNLISDPAYAEIKERLKGYLPATNEPESPKNDELEPPEPVDTTNKVWVFPGDTLFAWQFDYNQALGDDVFFFLDSAHTIGLYGCNDNSGLNLRAYADASDVTDAAQFNWDENSGTLKKNGQWLNYSANFSREPPYQLLLRARSNVEANFKLTIFNQEGDTACFRDVYLPDDFTNLGGGNTQTDWFLSDFPVKEPWGRYMVQFDWYDNIGEPGMFGEFSFIESDMDVTPPGWFFVSVGELLVGTDIMVMTDEDATVYLVPEGTSTDTTSIFGAAAATVSLSAYEEAFLLTSDLPEGNYVVYAIDSSKNISEGIGQISLKAPVTNLFDKKASELTIHYDPLTDLLRINCSMPLSYVEIFDVSGVVLKTVKPEVNQCDLDLSLMNAGFYFIKATSLDGNITSNSILKW